MVWGRLLLIQTFCLCVSLALLDDAPAVPAASKSPAAGKEAPLTPMGTLKANIEKTYRTRVATLLKSMDKEEKIGVQTKIARRKARLMKKKVSRMPRGEARDAAVIELNKLEANAEAKTLASEAASEAVEKNKGKLTLTTDSHAKQVRGAITTSKDKEAKIQDSLEVEGSLLNATIAKVHKKLEEIKSVVVVPDSVVETTKAAVHQLEAKMRAVTGEEAAAKKATAKVKKLYAAAKASNTPPAVLVNIKRKVAAQDKQVEQLAQKKQEVADTVHEVHKMSGSLPTPPVATPCQKSVAEARKRCFKVAEKEVRTADEVKSLVKSTKLKPISEDQNKEVATIDKQCQAKVDSQLKSCEALYKLKSKVETNLDKLKAQLNHELNERDQAYKLSLVTKNNSAVAKGWANHQTPLEPAATGIFMSDHAIWYVDKTNHKSLVKYPTIPCAKATVGIEPATFEDAVTDKAFYLNEKESERVCMGPAYLNQDVAVWAECECNGMEDDTKSGARCYNWDKTAKPWCYVNPKCAHPDAKSANPHLNETFPNNAKKMASCTLEKDDDP